MSDVTRGRELRPRVTRRPSPGLAARMKMLEQDAEKRMAAAGNAAAAAAAKAEIARSGHRPRDASDFHQSSTIVEEEKESEGGGARNGLGVGCSVAITGIIHTFNSQPASSDLPPLQPPPPPPRPLVLLQPPLQQPTNGAQKFRVSDENLVVSTTTSAHPAPRRNAPSKTKPVTPQQQLASHLLPPSPIEEDDAKDAAVDDDAEATDIVADAALDKHPSDEDHRRADLDKHDEFGTIEKELNADNEPTPPPSPPSPQQEEDFTENEEVLREEQIIIQEEQSIPATAVDIDSTNDDYQNYTTNISQPDNMAPTEDSSISPANEAYQADADPSEQDKAITTEEQYDQSPYANTSHMLQRRASVFSLSRASFASQLSRLTSLALPLSTEFSERIKKMNSSLEVSNAITSSAKQILRWIDTAKTVLKGLDSEDDVEWAAQGKKSLTDVDSAVGKFSSLMQVYVSAIDDLQARPDAPTVGNKIFDEILTTMEVILDGWNEVQSLLKGVKSQVETAMEWMELWTTILQDIQAELEACQTIVFEIEERRHRSLLEENNSTNGNVDIDALATIIEEPPQALGGTVGQEDASLLQLFARMQPLRASLDFLPMRLASFQARAEGIFPSAIEDLNSRQRVLENKWKKLNFDAEEMKRELGEDKWVAIFRNAGKQATHMMESVERSLRKLKEAVNRFLEGGDLTELGINKKVESYEAKRVHYGPAIQRVLAIIDKGVHDRLTVNGEILRLHSAMQNRWKNIEDEIARMDGVLRDLNLHASQQLRDSVSTIQSLGATSPASGIHTPESSPASSVVLSSPAGTAKTNVTVQRRSTSAAGQYAKVSQGALRYNTPPSSTTAGAPRSKASSGKSSTSSNVFSPTSVSRGVSPSPGGRLYSVYHIPSPAASRRPSASSVRSTSALDNRPRWNTSVNTSDLDVGHNFKPLSLSMTNDYKKATPSPIQSTPGTTKSQPRTRIPLPSPLKYAGQTSSPSSPPQDARSKGQSNPVLNSPTYKYSSGGLLGSKRQPAYGGSGSLRSPCPSPRGLFHGSGEGASSNTNGNRSSLDVPPRPDLRSQQSMANLSSLYQSGNRRSSLNSNQGGDDSHSAATTTAVRHVARPASAMAGGRRTSMLPMPKATLGSSASGRLSRAGTMTDMPSASSSTTSLAASGRTSRAGGSRLNRMSMPPKPATQEKTKWK